MTLPHAAKKQTTLLCFAKPEKTDDGDTVASLEGVMKAIGDLSLKVDNIEKQLTQVRNSIGFEDDGTGKSVMVM